MRTRPGAKRRPVVLYQPRDGGFAMPLGLLALGSWLAREHVVVVDGRFELAPEARLASLAPEALCLGVTTRTGAPLREALRGSLAARAASPALAVVWGGSHATADPASCLGTGAVDACVLGAGEEAMEAVVAAVRARRPLASVDGLLVPGGATGHPAAAPTTLWPRAEYALLDVERHFEARGARRLDYCASRGARDGEAWSGLRAERVVAEVAELAERYRLSEVLFRDEDFFADPERVDAIAAGLAGGAAGFEAGARVEDLVASPPERLRLLEEGGCRRLVVEVAAGGVRRELLLEAGEKLRGAGLHARFVFALAEPGPGSDGVAAAVLAARSLCALSPRFETPLRRLPPRPPGEGPPRTLAERAQEDEAPWRDARAQKRVARASFFFAEAQRPPGRRVGQHLVRLLALLRVRLGFFSLDLDRRLVELSALLRTGRVRPHGPVD